jgi:tRNA-splicing ligase RtcB
MTVPVTVRGDIEPRAIEQLKRCAAAGDTRAAALCADAHVGYSQPIGGAIAYRGQISPSGVGYDIGCGNKAVRTDVRAADLDVPAVMDEIVRRISFGMGRVNDTPVGHEVLDRIRDAAFAPQRALRELAIAQLGTVGAGNHYVDLFRDEEGYVWIGVHFGSRGFGHKTCTGFLAMAAEDARRRRRRAIAGDRLERIEAIQQERAGAGATTVHQPDGTTDVLGGPSPLPPAPPVSSWFHKRAPDGEMDAPPVLLSTDTELGQSYIEAMRLAGDYAYAGRDVVVEIVLDILGNPTVTHRVHNHHNYAWRELYDGEHVWVVRKGCTPAWPGQQGFVGATMGEPSVILEGIESAAGASLLYSTVHGAGRVMSRTKAAGKSKRRTVRECSQRDCTYVAPKDRHAPGGGPIPCPAHPDGRFRRVERREQIRPGVVDWPAWQQALAADGIVLRGGAADEAPEAYKRLDVVLEAHADTVAILHRLEPIGVAMAGADVFDAFKD